MIHTHLYVAFWRPDILAKFKETNARTVALCDYVGSAHDMTASLQATTCPACRDTFLNAVLPTGSGAKLSWFDYVAQEREREKEKLRATLAAQEAAKARAAQWTTEVAPVAQTAWETLQTKAENQWTTTPKLPPDGWQS